MNLYIRLKNGQPFEHPILEDNFRQAFPDVDVNNLPEWVTRFIRVQPPLLTAYKVYEGVTYEWVDGVVKDVHHVRQMTDEETLAAQNDVKAGWAVNGYASWVFNDATCRFDPPVPYPDDNKSYKWDESSTSWVEVTT
jgi:hypothetical protein